MAKGLQKEEYLCGPASLERAFLCLGVKVSQHKIAKIAGTTEEYGTDEKDIKRAIGHFGFIPDEFTSDYWEEATHWVEMSIVKCVPTLLCVRVEEAYDHWVCCFGGLGSQGNMRFLIHDPGNWAENTIEAGLKVLDRKALLQYWRAPFSERDPGDLAYYGIGIWKK